MKVNNKYYKLLLESVESSIRILESEVINTPSTAKLSSEHLVHLYKLRDRYISIINR